MPGILFSPIKVGALALSHRVVMAPLTRSRATMPGDLPNGLMELYYAQRSSPGGLIISEAAPISAGARGWYGAPGLFSDAQVSAWRKVTTAVHGKGGYIFAQLWHTGRSSHLDVTEGIQPVSASVDPAYWSDPEHLTSTLSGWVSPSPHRALLVEELPDVIEDYRRAAMRAKDAGFDGIEIHGANGYLIDQFLQDFSNRRTDAYGGSVANRARLLIEVVAATVGVWGAGRVSVRLGPAGKWNGMGDSDPEALFDHVAGRLNVFDLAYLHIIEPRVKGAVVIEEGRPPVASERLRKVYNGRMIAAGGFDPLSAAAIVERGDADLVAFGRHFVSNPDLPMRIDHGLALAPYDRDTFFTFKAKGYADYSDYVAAPL